MYPLLSLSEIEIDSELARRLPRRLAYYHLALPIAEDDDLITVAMAYPDNRRVEEVIRAALGTAIIPVRSHADEIRRLLDAVWLPQDEIERTDLVCWTDIAARQPDIDGFGQEIATALSLTLNVAHESCLEDFVECVRETRPALVVCETTDPKTLEDLLTKLSTSILLLRGTSAPPKRILHVLRGHTPDKRALDWVIPIAQHYDARITLLAAATSVETQRGSPLMSDFASLILPEHPAHVVEYGQMLASMNLHGRIKFAEGQLEQVLVSELTTVPYDLVAIATEVNGEVIHRVIQHVGNINSSFLIIKP
ncbi:MAG: hypothetical protein L0287_29135 [Anaerolineae bacterium]|nr:hypothetical protein [Anaerolineae bacterium]